MIGSVLVRDPESRAQVYAEAVAETYMDVVTAGIQAHPRSHQKLIGPSEIGTPCLRQLMHKLNQDQEPRDRGVAWKPAVGTALHNQMEAWFSTCRDADEFLVEQRVNVGMIGGKTISGSTDVFLKPAGAVIDHKFVGKTRLADYRANGPGDQYRIQTHIYGRGWELAGWPVHLVMIAFVPRDGELKDAWFWWEQYDRTIAFGAMARANRAWRRIQEIGIAAAVAEVPPCQDTDKDAPAYNHNAAFCPWCLHERAAATAQAIRESNPFHFGRNN